VALFGGFESHSMQGPRSHPADEPGRLTLNDRGAFHKFNIVTIPPALTHEWMPGGGYGVNLGMSGPAFAISGFGKARQGVEQMRQTHEVVVAFHRVPVLCEGVFVGVALVLFDQKGALDTPAIASTEIAAGMHIQSTEGAAGDPDVSVLFGHDLRGVRIDLAILFESEPLAKGLADWFDANSARIAYRVTLDRSHCADADHCDDRLRWIVSLPVFLSG